MKKLIDTSKMKVLWQDKNSAMHRIEFLIKVTETDDKVIEHRLFQVTYFKDHSKEVSKVTQRRSTSVNQKFLCIGGPQAGTKQAFPGKQYHTFNASDFNRGKQKRSNLFRCVWIHESMLRAQRSRKK